MVRNYKESPVGLVPSTLGPTRCPEKLHSNMHSKRKMGQLKLYLMMNTLALEASDPVNQEVLFLSDLLGEMRQLIDPGHVLSINCR